MPWKISSEMDEKVRFVADRLEGRESMTVLCEHYGISRRSVPSIVVVRSTVKPYVRRQKNDAADAAAICEAVTRPSMRFVPIKSEEQQAALMLHRA